MNIYYLFIYFFFHLFVCICHGDEEADCYILTIFILTLKMIFKSVHTKLFVYILRYPELFFSANLFPISHHLYSLLIFHLPSFPVLIFYSSKIMVRIVLILEYTSIQVLNLIGLFIIPIHLFLLDIFNPCAIRFVS